MQIVGRLYGSAATFLTLALLARELARDDFGRFTFYLAAFALLDSTSDLGLRNLTVQRTAADPGALRGLLPGARRGRLGLAGVGGLAVTALAFGLHEPGAGWIALACLYPLTHALELSTVAWTNRLAWGRPVAVRAAGVTLRLILVLGLLALGERRPAPYLLATAVGSAAANLGLHLAARSELRRLPGAVGELRAIGAAQPPSSVGRLVLAAVPLGLAALCQQLYFYIDNLFVRALVGTDELGLYNACVRVMSFAIMVPLYASLAGLPLLRRAFAEGRLAPVTLRLAVPMIGFGLLLALGGALCSRPLLTLGFGPDFSGAAPTLRWLFGAVAAVHAGAVFTTALIAAGANRALLSLSAAALALNAAANAYAVQRFGIEGAAATTLVTELFVAAGGLLLVLRYSAVQNGAPDRSTVEPKVR